MSAIPRYKMFTFVELLVDCDKFWFILNRDAKSRSLNLTMMRHYEPISRRSQHLLQWPILKGFAVQYASCHLSVKP